MARNPFRYFKASPEIIRLGVIACVRFPRRSETPKTFSTTVGSISGMNGARKPGAILTISLRIRTCLSEGESGLCPVSGEYEVCRNLSQFIRQYTITSATREVSVEGLGSRQCGTLPFASGATFSSPSTFSSANNGDGFALD